MYLPLLSATLKVVISSTGICGFGENHNMFTRDAVLRFEPQEIDGTIAQTHLLIRQKTTDLIVVNDTFTDPFYTFYAGQVSSGRRFIFRK